MAVKKAQYKGGTIINTIDEPSHMANDNNGLYYKPDIASPDTPQNAYATNEHRVVESNNPLWNQVTYTMSNNLSYASSRLTGHVTLIGIDNMGVEHDLMQHIYNNSTDSTILAESSAIKTFDLVQSSCTGGIIQQVANGSGVTGKIKVDIPKRYDQYSGVILQQSWMSSAWTKRKPIQINRTTAKLHGTTGHSKDFVGYTVGITYDSDMNSDLSDIRFAGADGITNLSYYELDRATTMTAGSWAASYVVMVPTSMVDNKLENMYPTAGSYAHREPEYIFLYYGNPTATTVSDPSLGGNAYFYDEFTGTDIDYSKWTVNESTGTIVQNNSLQFDTGSTAANMYVQSNTLPMSSSHNNSWEVIFKITNYNRYNTAVDGHGLRFKVYGTTTGETDSYLTVQSRYTTGTLDTGTSSPYYEQVAIDSGSGSSAGTYQKIYGTTTTETRYIKIRWYKRATTGTMMFASYESRNGYEWDLIGATSGLSNLFDNFTGLAFQMAVTGTTGTNTTLYIDSVIAYPIFGGETEWFEDGFQNNDYNGRWSTTNYTSPGRTASESSGQLTLANTTANNCILATGTYNMLTLTTKERTTAYTTTTDNQIYECEIASHSENTGSTSVVSEGGIIIGNQNTQSSAYQFLFGLQHSYPGSVNTRKVVLYRNDAGTVTAATDLATYTTADFPIKLRVIIDHTNSKVMLDMKKNGGSWLRLAASTVLGSANYLDGANAMVGLFRKTATTNSGNTVYNYFKCYSGGAIEASTNDYYAEEDSTTTYTATDSSGSTPNDEDMSVYFDSSTVLLPPNKYYTVKLKDFGGDYTSSKYFTFVDKDYISIGPDGMDKYIALKLEFDFDMLYTDTLSVSDISYIYEVI